MCLGMILNEKQSIYSHENGEQSNITGFLYLGGWESGECDGTKFFERKETIKKMEPMYKQ